MKYEIYNISYDTWYVNKLIQSRRYDMIWVWDYENMNVWVWEYANLKIWEKKIWNITIRKCDMYEKILKDEVRNFKIKKKQEIWVWGFENMLNMQTSAPSLTMKSFHAPTKIYLLKNSNKGDFAKDLNISWISQLLLL